MAFFMVSKGNKSLHEFDYLKDPSGRRLDPTLAPTMREKSKVDDSISSYAIQIMAKNILILSPIDKVSAAVKIFKKKNIHHIPIVQERKLVGLVSDKDLMWLNKLGVDDNETLDAYMSHLILVCHEDTPVDHIAHVFIKENINGMPVVDDEGFIVGMVTHHDILRWVYQL